MNYEIIFGNDDISEKNYNRLKKEVTMAKKKKQKKKNKKQKNKKKRK
jgi:hypothetical protein